jgi:hypothetical protein
VVRDPPRKSEQACRAVRGSRRQRAQPRRPNKCGTACIERRQRNGRRQRHRLRISGTQRKRLRRILGYAAPCPGSPERTVRQRCSLSRHVRYSARLSSYLEINGHGQVKRRTPGIEEAGPDCTEEKQVLFGGEYNLSFLSVITEDDARSGLFRMACNGHNIWIRYLFNSFKPDLLYRYTLCSRMDQTLACNTITTWAGRKSTLSLQLKLFVSDTYA